MPSSCPIADRFCFHTLRATGLTGNSGAKVVGEVVTHDPSQLTQIVRHIVSWFGSTTSIDSPTLTLCEEYLGIAGHLLLSAAAGAAFLGVVALATAMALPVVGALLVFSLKPVAGPPGCARFRPGQLRC